jgi:hypothetical protein
LEPFCLDPRADASLSDLARSLEFFCADRGLALPAELTLAGVAALLSESFGC